MAKAGIGRPTQAGLLVVGTAIPGLAGSAKAVEAHNSGSIAALLGLIFPGNRLVCFALVAALCGCAVTPEKVEGERLEPVVGGERIELVAPMRVIETRGPLAVKLEWQLLPGAYVERHTLPAGRVFVSQGPSSSSPPAWARSSCASADSSS